jgi:hypothetical protein
MARYGMLNIQMYNSSTVLVTAMHWLLQGNTNFGIWNEGNLTDVYFKQSIALRDKLVH